MKIHVPLTVPFAHKGEYIDNFRLATKKTGRLMLFAGDQKIEHLNDDFCGPKIHADDNHPEHLFRIAAKSDVGVFAAQLGLIATYGAHYRHTPYLVKMNSKTDLVPTELADPDSRLLSTIEQVIQFKKHSKLKIVGIGYTIYPGSLYEGRMLSEAAQLITAAHEHGLLAVIWMYPRGRAVKSEKDAHLIAGCAGIAASLGADFVKLNYPKTANKNKLEEIIQAAGRTGVVFSGGSSTEPLDFLKTLESQIAVGARGNATGRNIHQYGTDEAIRMANAIAAVSLKGLSAEEAHNIFNGQRKPRFNLNLKLK
jgi:fructose-bisphosphate aldolase/6-deoxy-5-ketofructose 1-phosphate synthase